MRSEGKFLHQVHDKISHVLVFPIGNTRVGSTTSTSDHATIVNGLTLWCGVLLDLSSLMPEIIGRVDKSLQGRIVKYVSSLPALLASFPLDRILTTLDSCYSSVLILLEQDESSFKATTLIKRFQKSVTGVGCPQTMEIMAALARCLFSSVDTQEEARFAKALKVWLQVSGFLKKLDIDRPDLLEDMMQQYSTFEAELATRVLPGLTTDFSQGVIAEMRNILSRELKTFPIAPFIPKHGPGRVAERGVGTWYEKNLNLRCDYRVSSLLAFYDLGEWGDYAPFALEEESSRCAEYICVPKSWKTMRGISAEPAELQYAQQGVLCAFDRLFREEWWSQRIDLHNQGWSRDLALKGSIDRSYATIDLSNASDSVTLELVRQVFRDCDCLSWLEGTRSTYVRTTYGVLEINKFAPMGSACCFPVECVLFMLMAEVARARVWVDSGRKFMPKIPRIFGDDIICDVATVPILLEILSSLGFTVNTAKSYWKGYFREACGIEAWHGYAVTPIKYKKYSVRVSADRVSSEDLTRGVDLANRLGLAGYKLARNFLLDNLRPIKVRMSRASIPCEKVLCHTFTGEKGSIYSPFPTNFNLTKRYSRDLQCMRFRVLRWRMVRDFNLSKPDSCVTGSILEEQLYLEWLIQAQDRDEEFEASDVEWDPLTRTPIGYRVVPTLKWVPEWQINSMPF